MSNSFRILVAVAAIAVTCATASAFARRAAGEWVYYHFDGKEFAAGQPADGLPFVAVRDAMLPVVLTHPAKIEGVPLPPGDGAVAGICYIRTSGGKLRQAVPYPPCAGAAVEIRSGERLVATAKTSDTGYFIVHLPAGRYTVRVKDAVETTVERGKTTLLSVSGGKRMVD